MQIIKLNKIKPMVSKYEKYFAPSAASMFCILSLLTIQPVSLPQKIAQATIDPTAYALTLATDPDFSLDLQPNLSGKIGVTESLVTVNALSPSGFRLFLSTPGSDNNIYLGGADSGESSETISATTGTIASPAALSANSWGVAVAGRNGFDASYTDSSASSKFAAVPTAGNEAEIYTQSTATSGDKDISLYYGVQANLGIETGNYPKIINYYTITEVTDQPSGGEATITPANAAPNTPQNIEITTSLFTDRHLGTVTTTIGGKSCTSVTISKQNPLTFTCDIPTDLTVGSHTVEVNAGGIRNYTVSNGFEIKVQCNPVATTIATGASTDALCMQDLTQSVLDAINAEPIGTQYSLKDARDGKSYYFAKQADGNIWMTQNLDLDLYANKTYTPADTDVTANWTPTRNTIVGTAYNSDTWTDDDNTPYSWDPGHYEIPNGNTSSACIRNNYSTCTNGVTAATNPGEANHYHVGNLYNWSAAVATNSTSSYTANYTTMPDSICPAGWKLPNGMTGSSTTGMYSKLLKDSGIVTAYSTSTSAATWSANGKTLIFQDPLYLVRGGYVYSGSVSDAGTRGRYWSSTSSSSGGAYLLFFAPSDIYPQASGYRYYGYSVRCVARTLSITYDANGGTGDSAQTVFAPSGQGSVTATLNPTIPARSGYNFLGFATSSSATTPDYTYSNGSFSPSNITLSENTTLYAVWGPITFDQSFAAAGKTKYNGTNYYAMQDMSSAICNNVTTGVSNDGSDTQTTQLIDTRDNKTYRVSKLADGNCWMTENLRLGSATESYDLTPSDTNLATGETFTLPAMSTDTSWTSTYIDPMLYPSDDIDTETNQYYGYYYNYNAATAGTITDAQDSGTVATSSICPKGWQLPPNGYYGSLLAAYDIIDSPTSTTWTTDGFANIKKVPLNFALSGDHSPSGKTVYYRGGISGYWSGTSDSTTSAYYLSFNSSDVSPQSTNGKQVGHVARCVAL